MGDVKEKFILDWQTVFPGVAVPDISYFANNETIVKEIFFCQERIDDFRFKLEKEEFILLKLKAAKEEAKPKNDVKESEIKTVKTDDEEESISTQSVWASVPKPVTPRSSIEDEELILPPPPSFEELSNDEANKESVWEFKNKDNTTIVKLEDKGEKTVETSQHRLSTFQPTNKESMSSSHTSLNEMFDVDSPSPSTENNTEPFEKFSNIKTHKKSYSIDENVFDYSSPIPIARRLTDPLPTIQKENSGEKPKAAPRTLTRSRKDKPLPPLPRKPLRSERNSTKDNVFIPGPPSSPPPTLPPPTLPPLPPTRRTISEVSSTYDDEHIYSDISELNINVKREEVEESCSENEESPDEVIYENSNMQPKIEPLVDNSSDSPIEEKPTRQLKRSGSHDRQAIALPDDMVVDITAGSAAGASLEEILNGSRESLVDELGDAPSKQPVIVVVQEEEEESSSDDDEHIYANVDDLILYRGSDDDSDHDPLADSISMGLPSPHYKEMTSDQIQSMLQKIQNNAASDHSQDESSDSEEPLTPRVKYLKKRLTSSSEIKRSTKGKEGTLGRTASTPLPHAIPEKPNQTPEELEEEQQHLKASRMRKLLVNNLLDSEKAYLDCLEMLIKFMKPLKISTESSQPILSTTDFKNIFHKAEELFDLHRDFYNQLEPRIASWNDAQLIGDLFTLIMHSFDLYLNYIGNYKVAMETILKCRQANQQFSSIMDQDIKIISLKDPLKLDGLLYKPVDRMTQYSLILNDLLKYTSPDHPDHVLVVEVSGALFDLFEQVNVDTSKKKRRQRQLLKELAVVEIDDGERRPRNLILFNDVIICAKLKPSGDAYVGKWYASLSDVDLKPYPNSESNPVVPVSSKTECDKIRANIANMRQELRREHMPLQQVISSSDASPPFMKRRNGPGVRASSRGLEKIKKKIGEQERLLHLISPSIPLNLYHKNGKCYTLLLAVEAERQAWFEALKPRLKRIHARSPPSIQLSSLELQQAFETVLKCQRLGQRFGSQMPSPFLGPTRPMSMDFSMFEHDKESLTGFLFVSLHYGKGFAKNSDTYVILEMDSYGHFFKKAKTKNCRGSDPSWEEAFEFEIEACSTLKLTCFNKLRLMGDDISGKCTINLTRENLTDNRNHTLSVSLDRGQSILNISLCFSTSIDGIKKSPSFSDTGVFGTPIQVVCKREKFDIPVIVLSCIKEIEKRGMDEIGIYRLSGVASEIQQLKKLFNEQTQNALLVLADTDIHAVAGLFKLYLRELPQSLFTSKLYRKFVQGLSITDSEEKELYMVDILHQLPTPNKITTLYLFDHLRRVTLLEATNKMGTNNLATVFGPTVLRPPSSNSDKENETSSCNVGTFDIGALDVMSQVGIFRYFLGLKNNERTKLPADDLELWRRLDSEKAAKMEEELMITAEEHLI